MSTANTATRDWRSEAAAEYVLGLQDADTRAAFEQRQSEDHQLRLEVFYWEGIFSEIGLQLSPVAPPVSTWQALCEKLGWDEMPSIDRTSLPAAMASAAQQAPAADRRRDVAAASVEPEVDRRQQTAPSFSDKVAEAIPAKLRWWQRAGVWQFSNALLALLVLALGFLLYPHREQVGEQVAGWLNQDSRSGVDERKPETSAPEANLIDPIDKTEFVVVMNDAEAKSAWVVRYEEGSKEINVRVQEGYDLPSDKDIELWFLAEGGPQSLGVMPKPGGSGTHSLAAPLQVNGKLAISLEPAGGSTTGSPTGPVLAAAAFVRI